MISLRDLEHCSRRELDRKPDDAVQDPPDPAQAEALAEAYVPHLRPSMYSVVRAASRHNTVTILDISVISAQPKEQPVPSPTVIVDMPPPMGLPKGTVLNGGPKAEPFPASDNGLSWQEAGPRTWILVMDRIPIARVTQDLQDKWHLAYVQHVDVYPTSGYASLHNAKVEAAHQALTGRKARLIATQREIALLQNMLKG